MTHPIPASQNPSRYEYRDAGGADWTDYLTACVAAYGRTIEASRLGRDEIKMLRRLQSGLSAQKPSASAVPVTRPRRAQVRRGGGNSLVCRCANCARGCESLCVRA